MLGLLLSRRCVLPQDMEAQYEAALERRRKEVEAERLMREHEEARLFGASAARQQAAQQQAQAGNAASGAAPAPGPLHQLEPAHIYVPSCLRQSSCMVTQPRLVSLARAGPCRHAVGGQGTCA